MSMAVKRTAAAGGADAQQTTAAGMWTQITSTMVAAGWTEHYSFGASDKVYTSDGESGLERLYLRYIQSGNQLDTVMYQHFQATNIATGVGVDGSTVALWEMEEGAGTTIADTTTNFDLTTVNGPTVVTGYVGTNARFFTRTSAQNATAAGNSTWRTLFQTGNFTIEGWVKPTATGTTNGIVGCNASGVNSVGHLHQDTSARLVFEYRNATNNGNVAVTATNAFTPAGVWTHVAVTRTRVSANNNIFRFYINGVLIFTSTAQVDPIAPTTQDVWLGRTTDATGGNAGNNNSYDGTLDHFRVSSVARTDSEILAAYWLGAGGAGTGYNALGGVINRGRYTFTSGQNIDYIIIADKDSVTWGSRNVTTGVLWHGVAGNLVRHPAYRSTLIADTGTYGPGDNVVVNLTTNPIAAGYDVDDQILIVSQQTFGSLEPGIIPIHTAYIKAITASSITVSQIKEVIIGGARIGEDPMPYFIFDGTQTSSPFSSQNFFVAHGFDIGKRNIYRDSQTTLANTFNGYSQLAHSFVQENAAESDPNNRTGRQCVDRLHIYGTLTGTSDTAPIQEYLRGWVPRLRACADQTKAQWAIGRDTKLIEHATLCDYAVTILSTTASLRVMIGPFTQAGSASFAVQPTSVDLTDVVVEGGVLPQSEMWSDPWDADPQKRSGDGQTDFMVQIGEVIEIDEGILHEGVPVMVKDTKSPTEIGTGPYLLGDGDRQGAGGGSNFNSGYN